MLDNNLATMYDLGTHITLEDAFDLIEFNQVKQHNKSLIEELKREMQK